MDAILVTTSTFGKLDTTPRERLEQAGFRVVLNPHERKLTEAEVTALLSEHDPVGLIAGVEPLTAAAMKTAPRLKAIARAGIGMDNVDQDAAKARGIAVSNTPDAPTQPVAELTMGCILCMLRDIHTIDASVRQGQWSRPMGGLLAGKTVGVIGCGRIGRRVAKLVSSFGCLVLGFDPYSSSAEGIELVSLDRLLAISDIVTIHMPYCTDTHHFINADRIAAMKNGAYLVNHARGGIVDENALYEALASGHLSGAALDCFEREPYKGRLTQLQNVLLTSHIGSYAREGRTIMENQAVDNILNALGKL